MKSILTTLFVAIAFMAFSQDYMDKIAIASCECIDNVSDTIPTDQFNMELGLCMLEASMPYKKQLKKDHGINFDKIESQGEKLGRLIGIKLASTCPNTLMRMVKKVNPELEFEDPKSPTVSEAIKPKLHIINEWKGNGTGFFISESGYIATNNHVINGASEIEVEYKFNGEILRFQANIIKVDKLNDLAVIQIKDSEYLMTSPIPYNFKTETIDIGKEVFALGYPMALTLMGKDIKFTDGRISSKTGLAGDITSYQIQVPIQPGNSGGPLFDFKGNLIGITSSGINRDLDITENVNYAIKARNLLNLIEALPETISLPSSTQLASKSLTDQIKILSDYVVLIKVR